MSDKMIVKLSVGCCALFGGVVVVELALLWQAVDALQDIAAGVVALR